MLSKANHFAGVALIALSWCGPLAGQRAPSPVWVTTLQSGMADTFQLTLGGMFGNGPAWQNKVTTGLANALRPGDAISVYAWDTADARSHVNNWQAGLGYKMRVLKTKRHVLALGSGVQRWLFPSVKSGANDWLIPGNLTYQTKLYRFPFTVTCDSWTVLSSPLPNGSLLHSQAWLQHSILKRDRVQITFKHGPAHTYSWGFWGANGNRIFRYQTMLAINFKDTSIEGGYRKQVGLQNGIQDNNYWQFAVTRTFTRPLRGRS